MKSLLAPTEEPFLLLFSHTPRFSSDCQGRKYSCPPFNGCHKESIFMLHFLLSFWKMFNFSRDSKKGFSVGNKWCFLSVTLGLLWLFSILCNLWRSYAFENGRDVYSNNVSSLNCHFHYIYFLSQGWKQLCISCHKYTMLCFTQSRVEGWTKQLCDSLSICSLCEQYWPWGLQEIYWENSVYQVQWGDVLVDAIFNWKCFQLCQKVK